MSSLFKLNGLTFNKDSSSPIGPLASLYQSKYESNALKYPLDVGSADKGHYVVFHINVQEKTQFKFQEASGEVPTILKNRQLLQNMRGSTNLGGNLQSIGGGVQSIVNSAASYAKNLTDGIDKLTGLKEKIGNSTGSINGSLFGETGKQVSSFLSGATEGVKGVIQDAQKNLTQGNFLRATKRTTDSIALYMPDTLQFDYSQSYSDLKTSEGMLGMGISAGAAAVELKGNSEQLAQKAAFFGINEAGKAFGDAGRAMAAGALGVVQNPKLELLYSSPNFREFDFIFKFYPRDRSEAKSVVDIINRLRFHQAPEILKNTGGFFMVPPSEFDIEFYYNGKQNPNIHKISTCVMTVMQVNFSPDGFSAYEIPGQLTPDFGGTGMPVSIELTLRFKETEILTKESFQNNQNNNFDLPDQTYLNKSSGF